PQQTPTESLVPLAVRQKLRSVAGEVAKTGRAELVERMTAALTGLGDDPKELERRGWEKSVASAKPSRSTSAAAAGKLEREIAPMVAELDALQEPRRSELARWIIEL